MQSCSTAYLLWTTFSLHLLIFSVRLHGHIHTVTAYRHAVEYSDFKKFIRSLFVEDTLQNALNAQSSFLPKSSVVLTYSWQHFPVLCVPGGVTDFLVRAQLHHCKWGSPRIWYSESLHLYSVYQISPWNIGTVVLVGLSLVDVSTGALCWVLHCWLWLVSQDTSPSSSRLTLLAIQKSYGIT